MANDINNRDEENEVARCSQGELLAVDGLLREFARAGVRDDEEFIGKVMAGISVQTIPAQHQGTSWQPIFTLAASFLIIVGGFLAYLRLTSAENIATVASASPGVILVHAGQSAPLFAGSLIRSGDTLQVPSNAVATVRYNSETTAIEMLARTKATLWAEKSGKRVGLAEGTVVCSVAKQPEGKPMRFITPQAEAVVVGTQLRLAVINAATRLEVTEGSVQLARNDQDVVMVNAGEVAFAAEGMELKSQSLVPRTSPQAEVNSSVQSVTNHFVLRSDGFSADSKFFPLGVWLQDPADAKAYKDAGINIYLGLWQGPTEKDLSELAAAGMKTICGQNRTGLKHINDGTIIGWMSSGEPDDAQPDGKGGYSPPVDPSEVIQRYDDIKSKDASRPFYLAFGSGVAWEDYPRLQMRENRDAYYEYMKGCDILSFHIWPVNDSHPEIRGNLWYVPLGVDNLHEYCGNTKPVWAVIECTKTSTNSAAKPTPAQVRSEVWMALIHCANGLIYYCHSFAADTEDDAALLHDPAMLAAVTDINRQIASLAPVLNSATLPDGATVSSSNAEVPVDLMVKKHGGATYVFAAAMRDGKTTATFAVPTGDKVEVLGENRTLTINDGKFNDQYESYAVHLYKLSAQLIK
jgi:hypothetical protein